MVVIGLRFGTSSPGTGVLDSSLGTVVFGGFAKLTTQETKQRLVVWPGDTVFGLSPGAEGAPRFPRPPALCPDCSGPTAPGPPPARSPRAQVRPQFPRVGSRKHDSFPTCERVCTECRRAVVCAGVFVALPAGAPGSCHPRHRSCLSCAC